MATKSTVPTVANGDSWSAAQHNTYLRDNIEALWPYTTAGDMAYASASNQLSRLPIGTSYKFLQSSGSAPQWGALHFASVYHNTTQNLANAVSTALIFNSEHSDLQGWHSTSVNTSRITVSEAGWYQASIFFRYAGAGGPGATIYFDTIEFAVNGTAYASARFWVETSAYDKVYTLTAPLVQLSASQYLEVYVEQNSGGTRSVYANARFSVLRIA